MRNTVYTQGSKPRIVVEVNCDEELLIACIKDKEVTVEEVVDMLQRSVRMIQITMGKGRMKLKQETEDVPSPEANV